MPYAINATGCRALSSADELVAGETFSSDIPESILARMRKSQAESAIRTMLQSCAWTQDGDAPINASEKSAWQAYRAALRALPSRQDFPDMPWPDPPTTSGVGNETGEQS